MLPPDRSASAATLIRALRRVVRRIRVRDVLTGAALAAATLAVAFGILTAAGVSWRVAAGTSAALGAAVIATFAGVTARGWNLRTAAAHLERVTPASLNLIVTAEELLRRPEQGRTAVRARVLRDAGALAGDADPARAVPLRNPLLWVVFGVAVAAATLAGLPQRAATAVREAAAGFVNADPGGGPVIAAVVTPPAYLAAAPHRLEGPERIEAVAGSTLRLIVSGRGAWRLRLGTEELRTIAGADGASGETVLRESSYIAIESPAAPDQASRRLIPVVVVPDRAPTIRIDAPGKDLLLPDTRSSIPIVTSASDDFGLRSLELKYTRVSGSGEQFEFEEGTIPLAVDRSSAQAWKGRAQLALASMKLEPGDSLVYRVVGADGRPGEAGVGWSDTYFVEIAGPGQVVIAGFELPPDRERYALSQQMIVLKIERLRAREAAMARAAIEEEIAVIAAEQRAVRANFIFLTGGHVEDEEEEAEHSHEIQEGRLEHSARKEISAAIQHMSRAEQELVAVDATGALPHARAAVEALQRAFGRNRYLLRTLPVRSRIDPSRRLSGELERAAGSQRPVEPAEPDAVVRAARDLSSSLIEVAPGLRQPSRAGLDRLSAMAERALSVAPGSAEWQRIAGGLLKLRDSAQRGGDDQAIRAAVVALLSDLRTEARRHAAPATVPDLRDPALRGALFDREGQR